LERWLGRKQEGREKTEEGPWAGSLAAAAAAVFVTAVGLLMDMGGCVWLSLWLARCEQKMDVT